MPLLFWYRTDRKPKPRPLVPRELADIPAAGGKQYLSKMSGNLHVGSAAELPDE
jgi:hypothetical protein